jgi:peptide/nickel transport system permease protein
MNAVRGTLHILRRVCATLTGATGLGIVAIVLIAALFAPWVSTADPDKLDVMNRFSGPSFAHWLGTDHLGRDLYSRLVHGATVALSVALSAIALALSLGTLLGIAAAYLPPRLERFVLIGLRRRLVVPEHGAGPRHRRRVRPVDCDRRADRRGHADAAFRPRGARTRCSRSRARRFLEAEKYPRRIVPAHRRPSHPAPNILGPLVILASMDIPVVITIEAGLSFLGLGVRPPLASWGTLIQDGYQFLSDSWVPVVVSSLALGHCATLGFTLFGEALRDAVDPRIRQER